jgi:hypothetical protein
MSVEFTLEGDSTPPKPLTPEEKAKLDRIMSRLLQPEERHRLECLLLERLKLRKAELASLWEEPNGHRGYEDGYYRYYHGSWKVYGVQSRTEKAVEFLRSLLPERDLNEAFMEIIRDGTGKEFEMKHNREWTKHTRPILEAFAHARYMIDMAVRHADLPEPPQPMPSDWAGLLYLYDLR